MDLYNLVVSAKLQKGGGGGDIDVDALNVTENGVYSASSGHAFDPVTVSVPQSGITPTGTSNITANGIYDVTNFASASVAVPGASGTSVITSNGIYDIASFASASVNVPGIVPSGTSSITSNGIYDITNFASVDVNVSGGGGGDHDAEDGIIQRTISGTYENSRVTYLGLFAFASCSKLETVNFPNVTVVAGSVFASCSNLKEASFPNATSIGSNMFYGCSKLETVSFPNATSIGSNAFTSCSSLKTVIVPSVSRIESRAFYFCANLSTITLPRIASIASSAFYFCSHLAEIYLLSTSVARLIEAGAFNQTPMSTSSHLGYFGSIYVPASLVSDYKTASNWSAYADRITSYVE